jgi:hypothetical protein
MKRIFFRGLSAVVLLFSFGIVNAGYVSCGNELSGLVEGSVDCAISDDTDVNVDGGLFGTAVWQLLDVTTSFGTSGEWVFSGNFWSTYDNVMLVFDSVSEIDPVGYLLDGESTSGAWDTPFIDTVFDISDSDVSQISYYGAGQSTSPGPGPSPDPDPNTTVPEPQTLLLFGLGLVGLVYSRKRKTL